MGSNWKYIDPDLMELVVDEHSWKYRPKYPNIEASFTKDAWQYTGADTIEIDPSLRSLSLILHGKGEAALGLLCNKRLFEKLNVYGIATPNINIDCLKEQNRLTDFNFSHNTLTNNGFALLCGLPSLRKLNVSGCAIDKNCVEPIAHNTSITHLNIAYNDADDASAFVCNTTLKHLNVYNTFKNESTKLLLQNTTITSLKIGGCFIGDSAVAWASRTNLTCLRIQSFDPEYRHATAKAANNNSSITALMLEHPLRCIHKNEPELDMMLSKRPGLIELAGPFDITKEIAENLSERKELESLKVKSITSEALELLPWLFRLKLNTNYNEGLINRQKCRDVLCGNFVGLVAIMFKLRSNIRQCKRLLQ
jgi:hypothetical protein